MTDTPTNQENPESDELDPRAESVKETDTPDVEVTPENKKVVDGVIVENTDG